MELVSRTQYTQSKKGISYLHKAANLGNGEAQYDLGYAYIFGRYDLKDVEKGKVYWNKCLKNKNYEYSEYHPHEEAILMHLEKLK